MFSNYKADLRRYFEYAANGSISARSICYAVLEPSLWAIGIFRFGKFVQRIRQPLLRKPFAAVYVICYKFCELLTGIRIAIESEIGPGLVIHNFGGIIIHGILGENCFINQGAQMITRGDGHGSGWPTVGNEVYIGSGAKLVGKINVGDNVRIGANVVVRRDVPSDSIVLPPEPVIKPLSRPSPASAATA